MPLNPLWSEVAREEPDARARWSRNEKKDKVLGWMEECFCVNCHKPGGMVTQDVADYVFYLCDECVGKHGHPPGRLPVDFSNL